MMNPRRVHELMTANFPPVELATLNWVNVLEANGTIRRRVLDALIDQFIRADDILVEVNRKLGDLSTSIKTPTCQQSSAGHTLGLEELPQPTQTRPLRL